MPDTLLNHLSDIPTLQKNNHYIQTVKKELNNKVKGRVEHFVYSEKEDILFRYVGDAQIPVLPSYLGTQVVAYIHEFYLHPGGTKTCSIAKWFVWWVGMTEDAKRLVRSCSTCRCNKISNQKVRVEYRISEKTR